MRQRILTTALLLAVTATVTAQDSQFWTAFPALSEVENIQRAGSTLYVQASGGLYSYNTADQSITQYDKTNALNDCAVKLTAWCSAAKRLVIVYQNGNIDLLSPSGETVNLSGYHDKAMTSDKTVNALTVSGEAVYMTTNFGIVKIDAAIPAIAETYNLGFPVDYCSAEGAELCAQSAANGLWKAPLSANLLDPSAWSRVGEYTPRSQTIDPELLALVSSLSPGGPQRGWFHFLTFTAGRLYSCGGSFLSGVTEAGRPGTLQVMQDSEWTSYSGSLATEKGVPYADLNCLAVDPRNPDHVFAGGRTGLFEYLNGRMTNFYNSDNSPLLPATDRGAELDNNYVLVHGLAFDAEGTLWLLNSQTSSTSLMSLSPAGEFTQLHSPQLMNGQVSLAAMQSAFFDSRGLLWFVNCNHEAPAIISYDRQAGTCNVIKGDLTNQDGARLSLQYVNCAAEDLDGNIWVGTDAGPFYIPASQAAESGLATLTQPKVPRNDGTSLADYLLNGVSVTSVAIDGAGRKWFGTNGSGAYLISRDNETQIHHFTARNSPLSSDNVEALAIDGATGTVYFGTDRGLCSYRSDATEPSADMRKGTVSAYPNPVTPDYRGSVTITGLTLDAEVKIVSAAGQLVAQGRSQGGSYRWDCLDRSGRRVSTGVYFVLTSTSGGSRGTVCKIAVVN